VYLAHLVVDLDGLGLLAEPRADRRKALVPQFLVQPVRPVQDRLLPSAWSRSTGLN